MRILTAFLSCFVFAIAGCGGGSGSGSGTGTLVLHLSDSPVDGAEKVNVTIVRVELLAEGEERTEILLDEPMSFDLLELQNDVTAVLGEGTFPAGDYQAIRLILAPTGNSIVIGGATYPLKVPSGSQTGIKLNDPFVLEEDVITELTIDFNVRRSIVKLGMKDEYILKPRLDLIANVISGAIEGEIDTAAGGAPDDATISAQVGGVEKLSTKIRDDGTYRLSPLEPGTYTVVVTAPGYANAWQSSVAVTAQTTVTGIDFTLEESESGAISGTTLAGDETVEIHLFQQGHFISAVGSDETTGDYVFTGVPVGTYDVALFESGVETDRAEDVEVEADTETGEIDLGLDEAE